MRKYWSLLILSVLLAPTADRAFGAEPAAAPSEVAGDAEIFPLEATAEPDELTIGVSPAGFGTTSAVHIRGRTLPGGKGKVTFTVEGPETKLQGALTVFNDGSFNGRAFTPVREGDYTIKLLAPDNKARAELKVTVYGQPDIDFPDPALDKAAKAAERAADVLIKAIEGLPPSPAKDDALPKLRSLKTALAAYAAAPEPERGVSTLLGAIRKDPALTDYARPRLPRITDGLIALRRETRRVNELTERFSKAAIGCSQMAFASEYFKAISALLNVKRAVLEVATGLSNDILADFAGNAAKAKGATPARAFAIGQLSKNAQNLTRAEELAGSFPGMLADLGSFLADTAFSTYCEQFVGPVRARMQAHFFQPQEWWSYSFKVTGRIILYYPKNAKGPSVPLQGRIEGIAHSFETKEDALTVLFPKLMARTIQRKRNFPPVDIGERAAEMAVLGNEGTSGYIEGSAAGLAVPNSFLLDVKGVLEKDSLSIVLGGARSDINAAHRVGVLLISPLALVPVFTWYPLPFQTVHHLLRRVSYGQAMRLKLTRSGSKMIAEGAFTRPAPTGGGSRGAYGATIKACNPSC